MASKGEIINTFVKTYRSLAKNPSIIGAEILHVDSKSGLVKIESKWSQRNIEKGEIIKFQRHHVMNLANNSIIFESSPTDVTQEILSKTSKSRKYNCVVKEAKQDNKKKVYIEIWDENGLFKNFDISAFDIHGDIYGDGEFGSLEWSPKEDKVIYVAEKKGRKSEPFYKQRAVEENKDDIYLGDEYLYKPDWGEQLVDKHQPVVAVCDIPSETLKLVPGIPSHYSPGQIFWAVDGNSIFGVAYENEPRRLGLIYCTNRPGYIFHLTLQGEFSLLSDKDMSVRSPRLSADGRYLFWLQRTIGGAHNGCHQLIGLDLKTKKKEIFIDVVKKGNESFSGLYMHDLPVRCFSNNGRKLFFSSLNRFNISSYYLDLETKNIHEIRTAESSTILDVFDDKILITTGHFQRSPALKISKSITEIEWIPITFSVELNKSLSVYTMDFHSSYLSHEFSYYNALYYGPSPQSAPIGTVPLLVYPHGGPHSAISNDYSLEFSFFASLGYGILAVNYRGSIGVGQNGVDFLCGKLGDSDVKDIHEAVLKTLQTYPCLDRANIFLYGKSYGGFLVAQLSAQHPDFYRAVVNGNGVSDVIAMYNTSDIPDWSTAECGLYFDESQPLSLAEVTKMVQVSPIQAADRIKAPTLFLVGRKDLRVPYFQGVGLYNALKARDVKVRLNLYDSNHTLGSVPVHMDCVINTALWFWIHKIESFGILGTGESI